MNVSLRSCNAAVMDDCARYPIYIYSSKRCIKFWLRILCMSTDRYVKKCYLMLKRLDELGYKNWVTSLRLNLYMNGFGYEWDRQSVQNPNLFISEYVKRLKDQYLQIWSNEYFENRKLLLYRNFKSSFGFELYLDCIDIIKFRRSLPAFRCSSHQLMIEKGRHIGIPRENRFCIHCDKIIECEYHFILKCPLYNSLRLQYIQKKYYENPSLHKFNLLMSCKNKDVLRNLAMFIYYAFKLRSELLDLP